jgi:hypothetical protein
VFLTFARWRHIREEHPELADCRADLLTLVARPEHSIRGRSDDERWLYGSGFGPTRFVKVAVHYEGDVGYIRTAFPRRRFP